MIYSTVNEHGIEETQHVQQEIRVQSIPFSNAMLVYQSETDLYPRQKKTDMAIENRHL